MVGPDNDWDGSFVTGEQMWLSLNVSLIVCCVVVVIWVEWIASGRVRWSYSGE